MVLSYKWFRLPFGVAGTLAAIPDATQPDGSVSYNEGFGPDYALDPATNPAALNIPRDKSNQLYNDITTALQYLQAGNVPQWISSADNGGVAYSYGFLAKVLYTDGFVYTSVVAANTATPGASVNWVRDRLRLTANTTFYVRTDGNDANTGLVNSAGGAFLTINGAISALFKNWDANGFSVTIAPQAGSFTAGGDIVGRMPGQVTPILINGLGATTIITNASNGFSSTFGGSVRLQNMKIGSASNAFYVSSGSEIRIGTGIEVTGIGPSANAIFGGSTGGQHIVEQNMTISGGGGCFINLATGANWSANTITFTFTGSPTFSVVVAQAIVNASITTFGCTFSGTVNGQRYLVANNAVITTNSGGANYFPGTSAGAALTGGQYS